jgi:hypothetical protein
MYSISLSSFLSPKIELPATAVNPPVSRQLATPMAEPVLLESHLKHALLLPQVSQLEDDHHDL